MPGQSPSRFVAGLVAEVAGIAVVITLLPKVSTTGMKSLASQPVPIADERPSLVDRTIESPVRLRPSESAAAIRPVAPDPAAVEERLDRAGQRLLESVSSYFRTTLRELTAPPVEANVDARPPAPFNAEHPRRRAFDSRFPHDGF